MNPNAQDMPCALLVDLDDTLLDDRGAMAAAVLMFRDKHGLAPDEADGALTTRWDEVGRVLWRRLARGEVTLQAQRRIRLREVFSLSLADADADALFADYLHCYEQCWTLQPGANEFLRLTAHLPARHRDERAFAAGAAEAGQMRADGTVRRARDPGRLRCQQARPQDICARARSARCEGERSPDGGRRPRGGLQPALALGMRVFHVNPVAPGRTIRDAIRMA